MGLVMAGKISLVSFVIGAASFVLLTALQFAITNIYTQIFVLVVNAAIVNVVIFCVYRHRWHHFQVGVRGLNLGLVFGMGLLLSFSGTLWTHFGWYVTALTFFHWSEYFFTAVTNPRHLALDSYLLDHSKEYYMAAIASWTEFTLEWYFIPSLKTLRWLSVFGLLMVIGGELLRKMAMYTARSNFNHYVQHVKEDGHQLVTTGVYAWTRHPAYVGWFYWSIGTQIILCNPICLVGYTYVSWKFFNERVFDEEISLLNFFGENYLDYQKKVGTGLPFIKGYRISI